MADEEELREDVNPRSLAIRTENLVSVAGKLIRNEDTNDAVARMGKAQQVSNSIIKIKSEASPAPYDGRGSVWYCHYYNARSRVIPMEIREPKYISQPDDVDSPADRGDGEMVRASGIASVRDYELKVIDKVKKACLKAKIGNQTELQRVDQLTNAKASMQASINQLNAYKKNIDAHAAGGATTIPIGGKWGRTSECIRLYGPYRGWSVSAARNDIAKKLQGTEQNIKETDEAIARAKSIATPDLNEDAVNKVEVMETELAKLEHLQAIVDASNSIYRTIKSFDSYYDTNDRCATTCQVYCQQACQNACQNNCTCHDQKCGAH